MTITLNLPSEVEAELREQAKKADLDPDAYILEALREHLRRTQKQLPYVVKAEAELLQKINIGLSQEEWQRYHELMTKRRAETLSVEEHQELIAFSDQIEAANVQRMEALIELAQRRQTSLEAVMEALGIKAPTYV